MPFNLKGRHFLSLKDNTPEEIDFLLQLSNHFARCRPGYHHAIPICHVETRQSGLRKVAQGGTSLEEVLAVVADQE